MGRRPRTIEVRTDGPTPGVHYPGEWVRVRFHNKDAELCAKCGSTLFNHIGNTGVVYPCWTPSGRMSSGPVRWLGVINPNLWQRFLKVVQYICILPEFF
jgi:hypothetical protein